MPSWTTLVILAFVGAAAAWMLGQQKGGNVINPITKDFAVAPQMAPADLAEAAKQGYKSIMVNRPDGEGGASQPAFAEMEAAAKALGLEIRYVPVVSGAVTPADAERFQAAYRDLPKPVLAYCRSGTRSTMLWNMSQQALQR